MIYALVTGGSSGMGLEYVRQLAARGYNVIITALVQEETDAVAEEMKVKYPDLDFVSLGMDLSLTESAEKLRGRVYDLRPDAEVEVLVNNAGVLYPRRFREMTPAQAGRIIMLHNYTMTMLCHIFLPKMLERDKGYILNISSLAAWTPYAFISTYSATKSYTRMFTKALRMECQGTGVKVATIYFGAVDTPLLGLSDKLRRIAKSIRVMITPERAVRVALRMLFAGRSGRIPGFFNCFYRYFVMYLIPDRLIGWIARQVPSNRKTK